MKRVVEEGDIIKGVKKDDKILAVIFRYRGTHHIIGMDSELPTEEFRNNLFDVSIDEAERVLEITAELAHDFDEIRDRNWVAKILLNTRFGHTWRDVLEESHSLEDIVSLEEFCRNSGTDNSSKDGRGENQ